MHSEPLGLRGAQVGNLCTKVSLFINISSAHTDTDFPFSREFKIPVALQTRYLYSQTFTNSHCHFLIPMQSVTSVLLQRHKPKHVGHKNCGGRPTANVLDYRAPPSLPLFKNPPLCRKARAQGSEVSRCLSSARQNVQTEGHAH